MARQSREAGAKRFDGTTWQTFNTKSSAIASDSVNAIMEDTQGNLWFACSPTWNEIERREVGGGVSRFDGSKWETYSTKNSKLPAIQLCLLQEIS